MRSSAPKRPEWDRVPTSPGFAAVRKEDNTVRPRPPLVSLPPFEDDDEDVPTGVSQPTSVRKRDRDAAALIRLDGLSIGEVVPLRAATTTHLGRSRDATVKCEDEGVSRLHAAVHWKDGEFILVDCGSRNGVAVDGRMVRMHTLADGEVIHLSARSSFRFVLMSEGERDTLKKLFDASIKDALTGVGNRAYFDERLTGEVAFAKRHGGAMSLVLLDVDHFKRVNDRHGHQAGDAALKYLAAVATSRLRVEDVFARYGGEEFGVILRGIDLTGAARVGERLRFAIEQGTFAHGDTFIPLTVSCGAASLACAGESTPEAIVAAADRRLYRAKNAGRNRVVVTDA